MAYNNAMENPLIESGAKRQRVLDDVIQSEDTAELKTNALMEDVVIWMLDGVASEKSQASIVEWLEQILLAAKQFTANNYAGVGVFYNHDLENGHGDYMHSHYQLSPYGLPLEELFMALQINHRYLNARETLGVGGEEIFSSIAILFAYAIYLAFRSGQPGHFAYPELNFETAKGLLAEIAVIGERCTVTTFDQPPVGHDDGDPPYAMAIVDVHT